MVEISDVELEEDLFILFASTVTFAAAFAGALVGNALHLHQRRQHREEAKRRVVSTVAKVLSADEKMENYPVSPRLKVELHRREHAQLRKKCSNRTKARALDIKVRMAVDEATSHE
ncbi:hypothetical protein BZA77DRAFT_296062 [Pyronema omphalodes]|nr:hypothetical protein BZA77DRAFT_297841 [Pyronema omphalodes]KAI5813476.1 hypothetical protein BZA77DRAFT_296062 [Pyronema omphalodes]